MEKKPQTNKNQPNVSAEPKRVNPVHERSKARAEEVSAQKESIGFVINSMQWLSAYGRFFAKVGMVQSVTILVALLLIFVLATKKPEQKYFSVTPDLRVQAMVPLSEPYVTEAGLLNWTVESVTGSLSFDFLHWQTQLSAQRDNFTEDAYIKMIGALKSSGILKKVLDQNLIITTVPTSAPYVLQTQVISGVKTWVVKFPVLISYQTSSGVVGTQSLMATVVVRRENVLDYPRGLAISQMVLG